MANGLGVNDVEWLGKEFDSSKKYRVEETDGETISFEDLKKSGFRIFETLVATDDSGIWYFMIKAKDGSVYLMPLRTD